MTEYDKYWSQQVAPLGQPRRHSILESLANTGSGFVISYFAGLLILPAFGFKVDPVTNFWIVSLYTGISIVRSYLWRRVFNWYQHR